MKPRIAEYARVSSPGQAGEDSVSIEEQFAAIKQMRAAGLSMVGIWHSHPETPARMSDEDLRLAYTPDVVYVILSLAVPGSPSLRGFTVTDGVPTEVSVEVENV